MTSKHRRFCPLTLYRDGTDIDRIIVVNDIPSGVDEDDLVEYIEDVCSCNVEDVYFSDDADHVALMKLEEPIEDLLGCKRKISRRKLDRQVISVQRVDPPNGIVVTDLPYGLTSDMLDSYFRSRASGNTSKSPVSLIMSSQIAIVKLRYPSKVLETILSRQHSPFDYSITVEPYYSPFHDEVVSRLKQESIKTYNSESSSEDSSNEGYKNESNESIDRSPTSRSSRGILNNQGSMSSRSSSAEYSDSSRQTKCFSIGPQSDESSDSSSESGKKHMCRGARQGKAKDRKRTRDCETVPLDMDYICENDEDKLLLAKIFKDAVGETFKDSMEMKYDCTIEIEFITKDEAAIRNAARQTGSRRGHRVKSGWDVASATNQLRKANHAVVDISSLKVMLSDNGFRELSNLHITSPYSFCEPRKVSSRTQAYRKNSFQFNNSTVTIKLGNITKERVDVIVNVVGLDQDYSGNRISSSIARAGGKGVTKMLEQHTGDSVMKIGSGNLPCDKIYTLTLDTYRGNKSEKIYKETIEECLNEGVTDKIRSISFPIIGYGKAFKYPKPFVLETLVSQTIQTTELPSNTSLKSFTIVTSDEDIYDDLETLLQQESSAKQKGAVAVSYQPPAQPPPTTVSRTKLVGCKIFINARKRDIDDLRDIIGNSVKEQLLYTKRITKTSSSSCMPLRTRGHTFGYAAKTKFVHVTDSDSFSITLKGHRDTIKMSTKEMVSLMDTNDPSKMCETFKCPPKFWKIIANEDPQSPPNWKNLEPNTELRVLFRKNPPKRRFYRVDVDKTTEKAVTTLVKKTWKKEHVGKGKDAVNLTHKNIRVKKVERIENLELFNKYAQKRVEYFRMLADERQQKFLSLDELKVKQQGMILTKQHLPDILKQDIFPEINEHFLFHGTKPDFIQTTIRSGLDSRLGNANGLFGSGMYTAESSTKADQYTDSKTNRTSGDHQMLLVRMLLGKMYVCSDPNPPKYRRPPCMNMECRKDNCTDGHDLHDSVVADGQWLFREFVVYSPDQCYPEYLITYERE